MPNREDWRDKKHATYILSNRALPRSKDKTRVSKGRSLSMRAPALEQQVILLLRNWRKAVRQAVSAKRKGNEGMLKVYLNLVAKSEILVLEILEKMEKQGRDFTVKQGAAKGISIGEVSSKSDLSDFWTDQERTYLLRKLGKTAD